MLIGKRILAVFLISILLSTVLPLYQYKNVVFTLRPDDRIILYTDGIVEASNTAHAIFGFDRFKEFIKSHSALPAGQFADALIRQLFNWSGKPSEEALDDDLTLIIADYQHV